MQLTKNVNLPDIFSKWDSWTDDFFNVSPQTILSKIGVTTPAVNVKETDKEFSVELAAPGMEKKDFNVTVTNGMLNISSKKEAKTEKKETGYTRKEFSFHAFSRSFRLPENVNAEHINAKYEKGVLHISLPKTKMEATKPKVTTIEIA